MSLGFAVTYLREHIPLETGDGVAFTLGASYERGANRFDAFAANLGGKVGFEGHDYPVDSYYVLGYGRAINQGWGQLVLGGQFMAARSQVKLVQLGAAYYFAKYFSLRTGFDHAFGAPATAAVPISGGLGFRFGSLSLDYGYTPHEYFSNTHTFSVGFRFGAPSSPAGPAGPSLDPIHTGANTAPAARSDGASDTPPTTRVEKAGETGYEIVAGIHGRLESAEAEAKALHLLNVPAVVDRHAGRFRVVVGSYDTLGEANSALERYQKQGHLFKIARSDR
ncbi:MAG: SPOR domain-containing protein [bacterium]